MSLLLLSPDAAAAPPATPIGPSGTVLPLPMERLRQILTWQTNIVKSRSGLEQRIALFDMPGESYEGEILLTSDVELQQLRAHLRKRPNAVYLLPLRPEGLLIGAAFAGPTFAVDTTYSDWMTTTGRRVMVEAPDGSYYTGVVQSLTPATPGPTVMALDTSPPTTYPAGSRVYPLFAVNLLDNQPVGRYPVNAGRWPFSARALSDGPVPMGQGATLPTSTDGRYILNRNPLNNTLTQEREVAGLSLLEFGGTHAISWAMPESDMHRVFSYSYRTQAERQFWKKFLYEIRGAQKRFYLPTWRTDIANFVAWDGSNLLQFTVTSSFDYLGDWSTRTKLWLFYAGNPTPQEVDVAQAYSVGPSTVEIETVQDALGLPTGAMFLETVRLSAEEVPFEHEGPLTVVTLSFLVIRET